MRHCAREKEGFSLVDSEKLHRGGDDYSRVPREWEKGGQGDNLGTESRLGNGVLSGKKWLEHKGIGRYI